MTIGLPASILAALLLIGPAGCSDDDSTAQCGDGIIDHNEQCDDGALNSDTTPDACRSDCTDPHCGDGVQDSDEACDDGNLVPGDGCDEICQSEASGCGNGVVEPSLGEECDDGNVISGDGCSADCLSEFCGDGVLQSNEECDDGADNSSTHADACRIDCTNHRCGDGVPDTGEECDDGNTVDDDGCSNTCTFTAGVCGNGVIDPGEECDDGNTTDGDGCDRNCAFEVGECGNGVLEAGEECDDGNLVPGDGCDGSCQLEVALCGDGTVDPGEECDNGPSNSDTVPNACRTDCRLAHCGDGVVDTGEACDDGNIGPGDGCDAACQVEVVPGCGNGVLDAGEGCDDGNVAACDGCSAVCQMEVCGNGIVECGEECDDGGTISGDGCDGLCVLEPVTTCQVADSIGCGDSRSSNTTAPGSTDLLDSYACSPWNESGREYAFIFTAPTDSYVTATLSGLSSDLDVFVIEDSGNGCDTGDCVEYGNTYATFVALTGNTYYVIVDGFNGAQGPFSLYLQCGDCGDGNVDPGEECDDGNTTDGDGCSAACILEGCGNGIVDPGEECDDNNTTDCDGCSSSCTVEECGNGVVECAEECDDGNTTSGDGCDASCAIESVTCSAAWSLSCGEEDRWSTSNFGATDVLDSYSCTFWDESGPEYIYEFIAPYTGQVTVALSELDAGVDLDMLVLDESGGVCASDNCIGVGTLAVTFSAVQSDTYYLVVDGYQGAEGNYTIHLSCAGGSCGDGVLNVGEACDDGNTNACDGCSAICTVEACGNGVVECGEQCDDGNTASGDGCSASCQTEATNCVPDWYLGCGDANSWSNDGSGSTDAIDSYGCSAWNESGPEYTYWFYAYDSGPVTVSITTPGVDLDIFVLEDDGVNGCSAAACIAVDGDTVNFTAVAGTYYYFVVEGYNGNTSTYDIDVACGTGGANDPVCGNGTLEAGEECDDGNTTGGDGCDSGCSLEGGTCAYSYTLSCGSSDSWTTEYSQNRVTEYGCTSLNESGKEYTYRFTAPATGSVTVDLGGIDPGVDLDLFVLLHPYGSCTPGNCIAYGAAAGGESVTFDALEGQTYYIVVDGWNGAEGTYDIDLTCN
jgi:cysteine-rich repeat protein